MDSSENSNQLRACYKTIRLFPRYSRIFKHLRKCWKIMRYCPLQNKSLFLSDRIKIVWKYLFNYHSSAQQFHTALKHGFFQCFSAFTNSILAVVLFNFDIHRWYPSPRIFKRKLPTDSPYSFPPKYYSFMSSQYYHSFVSLISNLIFSDWSIFEIKTIFSF